MTAKIKDIRQKNKLVLWFRIISVILICFGLLFSIFGLKIFSGSNTILGFHTIGLIPQNVLLPWESALYGAIMTGWGVTLLLLGQRAFQNNDSYLRRVMTIGLAVWLAIEAIASAWFGVWFNVGVDIVVFLLFAIPLLRYK